KHLVRIHEDGSIRIHLDYFDFAHGLTMTNRRWEQLFDGPARTPEEPITQRDRDLAASIQSILEEAVLRMADHACRESK
ncbi:carbamoyltransferase N-terminal domain-containing protein, partial [Klebsiella pneumoniae]